MEACTSLPSSNQWIGFSTAGKCSKITVSEESLRKASNILFGSSVSSLSDGNLPTQSAMIAMDSKRIPLKTDPSLNSSKIACDSLSSPAVADANRSVTGIDSAGKGVVSALTLEDATENTRNPILVGITRNNCSTPSAESFVSCSTRFDATEPSGEFMGLFHDACNSDSLGSNSVFVNNEPESGTSLKSDMTRSLTGSHPIASPCFGKEKRTRELDKCDGNLPSNRDSCNAPSHAGYFQLVSNGEINVEQPFPAEGVTPKEIEIMGLPLAPSPPSGPLSHDDQAKRPSNLVSETGKGVFRSQNHGRTGSIPVRSYPPMTDIERAKHEGYESDRRNEYKQRLEVKRRSGMLTMCLDEDSGSLSIPSRESIRKRCCSRRDVLSNKSSKLNKSRQQCSMAGVHHITLEINSINASSLRFDLNTGIPSHFLSDEVSRDEGGVIAFRQALRNVGIDTGTLSDAWFLNHSRWIIWKLASIERRFPSHAARKYLTFPRVIQELRYRYNKEIQCGMRPAILKVLNNDVSSMSTMILCVSIIHSHKLANKSRDNHARSATGIVELTDGWYGVKAIVDEILREKIDKGIIRVGTKVVVCNCILKGAVDGIDPLDDSYDSSKAESLVYLILSSNATRLAAWNARLGFVKPTKRLMADRGHLRCQKISDIIIGGGAVPCIDLIVCRVFPKLYLERVCGQASDSASSVLTESEEHARCAEVERNKAAVLERFIDTIHLRLSKGIQQDYLDDAQFANAKLDELQHFEDQNQQLESLVRNRLHQEADGKLIDESWGVERQSKAFLRVFVKSFPKACCEGAILTIWNTSESQEAMLKEGKVISFQNLTVRPSKREGLLHLTAWESTPMQDRKCDVGLDDAIDRRSFVPLFRHHLLSRRLCVGTPIPFIQQHLDMAGFLLKVVYCSTHYIKIYMTDDSGLISRIDCRECAAFSKMLKLKAEKTRGSLFPVAFLDIQAMPYDFSENCAVAWFTHSSSSSLTNSLCAVVAQQLQSPGPMVDLAATFIEAGASIVAVESMTFSPVIFAIGRIVGCEPSVGEYGSMLEIQVDCGSNMLQTWKVPFFLIDDALNVIGKGKKVISLAEKKSLRSKTSSSLQCVLFVFGHLFRFVLQRKNSSYEVRQLSLVDEHAISRLHSKLQQSKLTKLVSVL